MRKIYQTQRQKDRNEAIAALLTIAVVCLGCVGLISCSAIQSNNERKQFTEKCLSSHPGAHVEETTGYGGRNFYCLGPNGEVWDVQ